MPLRFSAALPCIALAGCVQAGSDPDRVLRAEAAAHELMALQRGGSERDSLADKRFDALVEKLPWYREQLGECTEVSFDEVREARVTFELECPRGELRVTVSVGKRKIRTVGLWSSALGVRPEVARVAASLVQVSRGGELDESVVRVGDRMTHEQLETELEALRRLGPCEVDRMLGRTYQLAFFVLECRNGGATLVVSGGADRTTAFQVMDSGRDAWRHWMPAWTDEM